MLVVCICDCNSIGLSEAGWILVSILSLSLNPIACSSLAQTNVMIHVFLFTTPSPQIHHLISNGAEGLADDIIFFQKEYVSFF